ncbi:3-oxoacyl-[acyl-carrier-protein] synthase III C-terminal domain-containing protein [Actinokineospora globicatena]|uniref:3-oxoacyl-ACP synthase n=1 Tax=Actinokineospora globicatena TaxID=103729 RepID=A0A9W6V5F4_9PSEU|nr:3-oxoacyl-[acyl-carrier-protein] synthase III C-terminal domain-containing protein [Actinokineospora globicatena]MCP2306540.1 3-oxoacyl-[acyl-carrier-protein] synthase-3 [Actinokineospora globicatena]GLW81971.1 3-oxoacyl-ACP synthase [Actinokineospora globicatena]GLW88765.1 3-oxoacyl-ACP synthase [Actinokineospora globicatena]GLW89357.1 3-oxoacyl-ACP synthase [Actinokineospora globicatena]
MTALVEVAAHLPPDRVSLEELAPRFGLTERQVRLFRRFHGLDQVCLDNDGTLFDLLVAATDGLETLRGNEHRVKYVLYARGMPVAVPYPNNPLRDLCAKLGLDHALSFTVTHQACATGLLALDVAGRLLASDPDPEALALVVSGEKTFTPDAMLVPETAVFGEGAAAALVAADGPNDRVLSIATSVRGDFDGRLIIDPELAARFQYEYPRLLSEVLLAAVDRAGLTLDDIAVVLPHNVNSVSWRRVAKRIGYPVEQVLLDNVPVTGHSFAADPFLNYRTALDRGRLRPGERYLVGAAGLGATFSAMVFEH